jgi:hypothetical protein
MKTMKTMYLHSKSSTLANSQGGNDVKGKQLTPGKAFPVVNRKADGQIGAGLF